MSKYPDYQVIDADNFAAIMKDTHRLVCSWLYKSRYPHQHWEDMIQRFWEQVWIARSKFDRSRGRLSTWLGWQWKGFLTHDARAFSRGYREIPMTLGDGSFRMTQQVRTTNWGLNPQLTELEYDSHLDKRHHENKLLQSYRVHVEDQLDRRSTEVKLEALNRAIEFLTTRDQKIIQQIMSGMTLKDIGLSEGVTRSAISDRLKRVTHNLRMALQGKARDAEGPSDTYWAEYHATSLKSSPHWMNDWSHASLIRTRNSWT